MPNEFTNSSGFRFHSNSGTTGPFYGNRNHRLLSRPVGVRWAGWETDTLRLQRAGWQLAVETDTFDQKYRLLMHHEQMRLTALSHQTKVDYEQMIHMNPGLGGGAPVFEVKHVAPTFEIVRIQETGDPWDFKQIDAQPRVVEHEVTRIEEMNIFHLASLQGVEEVVIDKADMTVIDHLQAIKDLQSETQRKLREKARRREREPGEERVSGEVVVQLVDYK